MPTATHITSSYNNVDQTSYTTGSFTPTASRWIVIDVYNRDNLSAQTPTISSSHSLAVAWTQELTVPDSANDHRVSRWYARTGASPGASTITIDFSAVTQVGCGWIVYEASSDWDASDPFVLSASNVASITNSVTVTLSAFASSDNRPLICAFHRANEASTPEAGYTEIGDVAGATPDAGFACAYHGTATDTTPSYSWTTTQTPVIGVASEIKAAAGGSPPNVFEMGWMS